MNNVFETLVSIKSKPFKFFEHIFLFGSCLWSDVPNDIDILLVYDHANLMHVNLEVQKVVETLTHQFPDCEVDFTILSVCELKQTGFLERIDHKEVSNH